ncbi:putative calpain-like cysteine peptidase [Trypanosoma grayi]|uniref:putative calpain-like cysteine peptidase n=1 Tax=Trypanosoma grayi TaxID=71804 RepID=UPI0004F462E7|nr:putative calpain-like cysteine peptidase [Trypanosoma grayi]KEG10060.1 putative calpain-like cysteine peptidase [Trypanosoma grayi]
MSAEILMSIQNGLLLERQGKLREAEECFTQGINQLRRVVERPSLGNSQKMVLTEYMEDAARHILRIRAALRYQQRPLQQQQQQPSSPLPLPEDEDYLGFLEDLPDELKREKGSPSTKLPKDPSPTSTPAAATTTPSSTPTVPQARQQQPPPPHQPIDPLAKHFAPRASEIVMKAIDVATTLARQREYKRAVDVLQHAYDVGIRERNKPGNFQRVEEHLRLLRREYYNHFKPRFVQDNSVLPEEMEILRKSGITATILLPIWDDLNEGYGRENVFMPCEGHWEDSFTPRLDTVQQRAGAKYLRISEVKPNTALSIIHTADPLNVKQTVVSDCSMVCSLIICASYQQRFPKGKIINNVIFPQDNNGDPIVNPKGKYCVKMLINGITRLITVDDRFPANPRTGELLCTYSRDNTELWASIMEKAFVKVCGGSYDFPGSTSSSDLYKLSGWLPDGISLNSEGFDPKLQWMRLYKRHVDGSVLITANTGSLAKEVEESLTLPAMHAYAVLSMQEINGIHLLQLKNPWARRTWSGAYSFRDSSAGAKAVLSQVQHNSALEEQGIFWITWEDLCSYFSHCSLSWNPYMLFKTPDGMSRRPLRLSCHARFPYTTSTGQTPQFHIGVINAPSASRMHLVFSRHITDVEKFGEQFEKNNPKVPYVAIKVYDVTRFPSIAQHMGARCTFGMCYCRRLAHGTELDARLEPLNEVVYRNMAAHTQSFNCPAGTSDLLVVVGRLESAVKGEFSFSLTLHTEWPQMKLNAAEPSASGVYMHAIPRSNLKQCTVKQGRWVKGMTCGGRSSTQTFVFNPQYSLSLSKPSMLSARLCLPECELSAQLHVVRKEQNASHEKVSWAARVGSINVECSFLLQAPLYAHGGVVIDTSVRRCLAFDTKRLLGEQQKDAPPSEPLPLLPAGDYTIVPAQWENGVPAEFELVVETTEPHELREIPAEGDGFTKTTLYGQMTGGTVTAPAAAASMPNASEYFSSNSKASFIASSPGVVTVRLLLLLGAEGEAESGVAANVSLFRAESAVAMALVATSGPYDPCSAALPPVKVEANVTYVLVVSSSKPSSAKYVLRFYSSCPLKVQPL